jgi:hypothetical protein
VLVGVMNWPSGLLGLAAGLLIAVLTAPVSVSGAVFLLPVQLSLLRVPSPAVTPTNLLFNVVAVLGAVLRYLRHGRLSGRLTRQLVAGTLPGVVISAVIRVYAVPGPRLFRLIVAGLLPLGVWLATRTLRRPRPLHGEPSLRWVTALALIVGIVGGSTESAEGRSSGRSWPGAASLLPRLLRQLWPPPS